MRNYSYKLYTCSRNEKLHTLIDSAACIWNHCVALNNRFYRIYKCGIQKGKLEKHICKLRWQNPYWKKLNSQTVQEIVQRYEASLIGFFKGLRKRRPKKKKRYKFSSIVLKQSGYKISDNAITLNGIGRFGFHKSRQYGDIRTVRIKRTPVGNFFLVICSKHFPPDTKQYSRKSNDVAPVGIDFGMKTFLTLSNKEKIQSPLFYRQEAKNIKKCSKKMSLAVKGSGNRKKRRLELARAFRKMNSLRTDHQWKLAHELCGSFSHIFLEDLNMDGMKRLWGRKISDLCFSEFMVKLKHVATKYGTIVHQIDRFYPSSKTCSCCGYVKKDLDLRDREWTCPICGTWHERDENASVNILREGILSFQRVSKTICKKLASFVCMEKSPSFSRGSMSMLNE